MVTREQIDHVVASIRKVVELANSPSAFWSDALGLARRAVNIYMATANDVCIAGGGPGLAAGAGATKRRILRHRGGLRDSAD